MDSSLVKIGDKFKFGKYTSPQGDYSADREWVACSNVVLKNGKNCIKILINYMYDFFVVPKLSDFYESGTYTNNSVNAFYPLYFIKEYLDSSADLWYNESTYKDKIGLISTDKTIYYKKDPNIPYFDMELMRGFKKNFTQAELNAIMPSTYPLYFSYSTTGALNSATQSVKDFCNKFMNPTDEYSFMISNGVDYGTATTYTYSRNIIAPVVQQICSAINGIATNNTSFYQYIPACKKTSGYLYGTMITDAVYFNNSSIALPSSFVGIMTDGADKPLYYNVAPTTKALNALPVVTYLNLDDNNFVKDANGYWILSAPAINVDTDYDTNRIIVQTISTTLDLDLKRIITSMQNVDTDTMRFLNADVNLDLDLRRNIAMTLQTSLDADLLRKIVRAEDMETVIKRAVEKANVLDYTLDRRVNRDVIISADLLRAVTEKIVTVIDADMGRKILKDCINNYILDRKVNKSADLDLDTVRVLMHAIAVTHDVDLLRIILRTTSINADSKRELEKYINSTADTYRKIGIDVEIDDDLLRVLRDSAVRYILTRLLKF